MRMVAKSFSSYAVDCISAAVRCLEST